jgi:hypothetical protein
MVTNSELGQPHRPPPQPTGGIVSNKNPRRQNRTAPLTTRPTAQQQGIPATPPPATQTSPPLFPTVDRPSVVPLIQKIEQLRSSRVITYFLVTGTQIAPDAMPSLYEQLRRVGHQEKIDLWIHSHGGATEVPWRMVQMLRCYCKSLGVLVTEVAQSAATHVALGADEIVMGPFSLLSPVDPARQHPLLPKGIDLNDPGADEKPFPVSVQDLKHAVAFVKREAGEAGLTGDAYARVISVLFEKVHPLAIGAIEQSYELSKLITRRMLSTHMDEKAEADEIERLTDELCDAYKSHGFPIGLSEADRLGLKVTRADEKLYNAMWDLKRAYDGMDRTAVPVQANHPGLTGVRKAGQLVIRTVGHIDTTDVRFDCNALLDVTPKGVEARGANWTQLTPGATASAGP